MSLPHATAHKVVPYSVYSEKVVLGALVRDPACTAEVAARLPDGRAFFRPELGRLYDILLDLGPQRADDDGRNPEILIGRLEARGDLARVGGAQQIRDLAFDARPDAHVMSHVAVIIEKAWMRKLVDAVSDMLNDAYRNADGFEAVLARGRARLDALAAEAAAVRGPS